MTKKATATADTIDDREGRESRELRSLILWARANRIALSEAQVGMTRVVLADLTLAGSLAPPKPTDKQLRDNLYAEYGGEALAEATREDDSHTTELDDEYDGADEE